MSWDLVVLDLPPGITDVAQLPKDFKPRPLGSRSEIIAKIIAIAPEINVSDPSWGILKVPGCYIEFNFGRHEQVGSIGMHVRGDKECPDAVAHILDGLRLQAIDTSSESGLFENDRALRSKSFERWRSFRSRVDDILNSEK